MKKKSIGLREIERFWDGPMANTRETRIRFAIWDAMRFAAKLASGEARAAINKALRADIALFDRSGTYKKRKDSDHQLTTNDTETA